MNIFRPLLFFVATAVLAAPPMHTPLDSVRFEQRLGERLPLTDTWQMEDGSTRTLVSLLQRKPAIVWFGYDRCPQLCSIVGDGLTETLRRLRPSVGADFSVLAVSIDSLDTSRDSAREQARAVGRYGRTGAGAGWHYLTGNHAEISAITRASGFHFLYDERSQQFAHAAGFLVVTPQGRIARYFLGVDFPADEVADALVDASHETVGRKVFDLVLRCFRGDSIGGRYGPTIWRVLEISVAATVIAVFGGIGFMLWLERMRLRTPQKNIPA